MNKLLTAARSVFFSNILSELMLVVQGRCNAFCCWSSCVFEQQVIDYIFAGVCLSPCSWRIGFPRLKLLELMSVGVLLKVGYVSTIDNRS